MPDGKPELTGHFSGDAGGANYGLEAHPAMYATPPSRGIVLDPPDGKLPYQDWARAEFLKRWTPERGYTIRLRTASWRAFHDRCGRRHRTRSPAARVPRHPDGADVVAGDSDRSHRKHLPDDVRLWQGDSIGHWEGDTLVVDTANNNGKTWMNESGDVISYAATAVERFTPVRCGYD